MEHRKILLAASCVLASVSFSGCGEITRLKLVGTWQADVAESSVSHLGLNASSSDNPFTKAVGSIIQDATKELAEAVNAKESVELNRDGTMTATLSVRDKQWAAKSGTWAVTSTAGDETTLAITYSGLDEPTQITLRLRGEHQFEGPSFLGASLNKPVIFNRLK